MVNEKFSNRIMLIMIPTTASSFMQVNKIGEINIVSKRM
jgi:hypothetical protein